MPCAPHPEPGSGYEIIVQPQIPSPRLGRLVLVLLLVRDLACVPVIASKSFHPSEEAARRSSPYCYTRYDGAGNISSIGSQQFRYDGRSQLTSGQVLDSAALRSQTVMYDDYGNITQLVTNGQAIALPVLSTNRLGGAFAHDAAGNLTKFVLDSEVAEYTYDALNMMKHLRTNTDLARIFLYTAGDERLATFECVEDVCQSRGSSETWTLRDLDGKVLRSWVHPWSEGWQWKEDHVFWQGQPLTRLDSEGAEHLHLDHSQTARQATGTGGSQTLRSDYYPLGEEVGQPKERSLKFTSHERDESDSQTKSTLDYMHARHYSPFLARFLSIDPKMQARRAARIPLQWNRYVYSANNPLGYIDPDGRDAIVSTFVDYSITTPIGTFDLGHSGIAISQEGRTRYYEFGRYVPTTRVSYRGPLPDLDLGSNGVPTKSSLKSYLRVLSSVAGQGNAVKSAYFINENSAAMKQFTEDRRADASLQGDYNLLTNNCATFCEDVLEAGGENLDVSIVNTPANIMQELQDVADFSISYDPETDELEVDCNGNLCPE